MYGYDVKNAAKIVKFMAPGSGSRLLCIANVATS